MKSYKEEDYWEGEWRLLGGITGEGAWRLLGGITGSEHGDYWEGA